MSKYIKFLILILSAGVFLGDISEAQTTTTPQLLIYEGELLDDTATPLAGDYTFRFSFWANTDYENTDVSAGSINVAAIDYYGWQEVQNFTLNPGGRFTFQVGTINPFVAGMFDQDALYLQVEVKESTEPDTAYEVIDVDSADINVDRKVIASVPFAFNANKLDFRDTGFNPGDIPFLDPGTGLLPGNILPNGANENEFIIDADGDALVSDTLTLQFGDTNNESLAWNGINSRFELSDDLNIDGDLTVTGTINGVVLGPREKEVILSPRYPNSIFEKDGTDNSGQMYEEVDTVAGTEKHTLRWETKTVSGLKDYDTLIRFNLPVDFVSWLSPAVTLEYKTEGTVAQSQIDMRLEKGGSAVDELSGTALDLSSNAWTTGTFNLAGATTWAAGDTLWVKLKMHSSNSLSSQTGDLTFRYLSN